MNEIDEDLIPGYTCIKCGNKICKDEAFKREKFTCVCLDCSKVE